MKPDLKAELILLEGEIAYHDFMFFGLDRSIISDAAYDEKVARRKELIELIPDYTPTMVPGFTLPDEGLPVVRFTEPMLSVDKYKNKESIEKYQARRLAPLGYSAEEKMDGVATRLVYEYGVLTIIHLRGDGEGTVVTHRYPIFVGVDNVKPEFILLPRVEVTGEAYVFLKDLEDYADQWEIPSPESRSTVSGMLKRRDPSESDTLPIRFKAFQIDKVTMEGMKSYLEVREWLVAHGFEVPRLLTPEELEEAYNATEKPIGKYAVDGVVIKNNDLSQWNDTHMAGYWTHSVCFKYPTRVFYSKITDVIWALNTKGYLEGTLIYEPVEYDGSTMRRARFNYVDENIKAGIAIGSTIEVTKSHEIIPNMLGLKEIGDGEKIKYPTHCPACDDLLEVVGPGAVRCVNETCPGKFLVRAERLVEPRGLNILNLGPKRLMRLIDVGLMSSPVDLFKLTLTDLDNADIESAIAEKIIKGIHKSTTAGLNNWLYAISIPHLGFTRATELANEFGYLFFNKEEMLNLLVDPGFMCSTFDVTGLAMAAWCEENRPMLEELFDYFNWDECVVSVPDLYPVACTGSWNLPRNELKSLLVKEGYQLEDVLSKSVRILLVGDGASDSKISKAQRWGIPVVNMSKTMSFQELVGHLKNKKEM